MKNADLPAMPSKVTVGEGGCIPFQFGNRDFVSPGLTKREYFAALAMQGYTSAGSTGMPPAGEIARLAVVTADALLEELNKRVT